VLGTKLQNPSSGFGSGLPILKISGYAMTEFEKLKLPPSFEIVTVAEFLAALQPARDIARIGSKIVAILDGPTGTSRNIYSGSLTGADATSGPSGKLLGYAWLCARLGLLLFGSREDRCRSACAISGLVTGPVGAWTARNVGYWRQVRNRQFSQTVLTLTNRTTPGGDDPRSPE
jgi:hypothetical protein